MNKWNTTKLMAAGSLGALAFIMNVATGMLVVLVTGVPGSGGLVMALIFPIIIVLTCFIIPIFPSMFITGMVFSVLSLAVPILGPPGFLPKILVVALAALSADAVASSFRKFFREKEKLTSITVTITSGIVLMLLLAVVFKLFLPSDISSLFLSRLPMFLGGSVIIAPVGAYIGYLIYKKLENTSVVKRIQA